MGLFNLTAKTANPIDIDPLLQASTGQPDDGEDGSTGGFLLVVIFGSLFLAGYMLKLAFDSGELNFE